MNSATTSRRRGDGACASRPATTARTTGQGLAQMARIDAAMADIEAMISGDLGERRYQEFKHSFRRVTEILANET